MNTEIIYILDRSGSMSSIWNDVFNGLNRFIEDQKKIEGQCKFSLVLFDNKYEVPIKAENLQGVERVSSNLAFPRGTTALLDAIGKTINEVGQRLDMCVNKPEKVIVVIMTDGYENSSKEYNRTQVRDMIQHQEEKYSWEFIFMGADMDAVSEGQTLGMKAINTANFEKTTEGIKKMYSYGSVTAASYRTS